MADVSLKRHREPAVPDGDDLKMRKQQSVESEPDPKKLKSYNHIISILEQDEDESDQDLSSLMSSLENEISCNLEDFDSLPTDAPPSMSAEDEYEKERVMRHLLEASDDELGIPASRSTDEIDDGVVIDGGDSFGFCEGLWELEDEAANYNTLLQSELFM
uniref:Uncharacterized protein n=1 Tax=Kalanchoe fedtschenkoi TaxID=63787 RepID=A0A7N0UFB8_KALFE